MGRIHGFVVGTVTTTGLLFYSTRRLQQDTQANSQILRESREVLDSLLHPPEAPRKPVPRLERPSLVETMKDLWNEEIERGVHYLQNVDWNATREKAEDYIEGLWDRITKEKSSGEGDKST